MDGDLVATCMHIYVVHKILDSILHLLSACTNLCTIGIGGIQYWHPIY